MIINYLEITNDLAENFVDKPVDKEISISLDYLKFQGPRQHRRLWKSYFTNNLTNKTTDIFIYH